MKPAFITHHVRPQFIICLLLTILTLSIYYPVGQFEFINYDDPGYVTQNRWVQSGLNRLSVKRAFTSFELANWHPLTWLSHTLDVTLYGMNPGAHHLTNVQFHILNTLLLFLVLLRMTNRMWKSAVVAALFAIHPLHIESVAWVSERKDVLSAFFFMLTLWCYAAYVERPSLIRYLLVMVMFVLGLMAKPMLVTLPFLLLLLDYWPLDRLRHPDKIVFLTPKQHDTCSKWLLSGYLILEKTPLIMLSGISSIVTFIAQQEGKAVSPLDSLPIIVRIANSLVSYVNYIWKLVFPINLSVLYPYPNVLPLWKTGGSFLILILFSRVVIHNTAKKPYMITGWFWFMGMLVPVIGLVQVGIQSMADRYTYLPAIGLFILGIWGFSELILRFKKFYRIQTAFAFLSIVALAIGSYYNLPNWKNSISLFSYATETTKQNIVAHLNLGMLFLAQNHFEEAYEQFNKALKIKPNDATAIYNIGFYHDKKGNYIEAITYYEEAIRLKPDLYKAYNCLGVIFTKMHHLEKAVRYFDQAISINPTGVDVYGNLGIALSKQKRFNESIDTINKALRIDENFVAGHLNLGTIFAEMGKFPEAIHHLSIALQLLPEDETALSNLRLALAEQHRIRKDSQNFRQQIQLNPEDFQAHYNLAVIYKRIGNSEDAFHHFAEAVNINPNFSPALQNLAIMHAIKGEYDQALEILKRMTTSDPGNPMGYYYAAGIYARKGQFETAVDWLRKAVEKGFSDMALLKNDANMRNIQDTAYYQELVSSADSS